jgi:GAF domain-containing protein
MSLRDEAEGELMRSEVEAVAPLPRELESVFEAEREPDQIFTALMPAICEVLQCDRVFLYLRNPETQRGCITHCYCRDEKWENLAGVTWIEEGEIAQTDPLMAIAFRTEESVFVEDIETASPEVINLAYEQEKFRHRALIHTPIYCDRQLYGILEPCVFELPRIWTDANRRTISRLQARLGELAKAYVQQASF